MDGVKERTLVGDNVGVTEGNLDGNKSGKWKANTLLQSGLRTDRQNQLKLFGRRAACTFSWIYNDYND